MKKVTENIFVETEFMGCNTGFITTSDGIVQIDSPSRPSDAVGYLKELEEHGELLYLINTEPHADHISSNFMFDAVYVAHQGIRDEIEQDNFVARVKEFLAMVDPEFVKTMQDYFVPVPDITFTQAMTLYTDSHSLFLENLPGHTKMETAVYIPEERAVFTGDNIFHKTATFMHDAVPKQWLESLERLKEIDADFFIPGHGDVCEKGYLDEQARAVKEWIETVNDAVHQGWTLDEAQEKISFLDRYPMPDEMKMRAKEIENRGIANLYGLAKKGEL